MSSATHRAELPRTRGVLDRAHWGDPMLAALTLARLASVYDPPFGGRR